MNEYQKQGFNNRQQYLASLADSEGVPLDVVHALADILGPSEDFDGLVTAIQDYGDSEMVFSESDDSGNWGGF